MSKKRSKKPSTNQRKTQSKKPDVVEVAPGDWRDEKKLSASQELAAAEISLQKLKLMAEVGTLMSDLGGKLSDLPEDVADREYYSQLPARITGGADYGTRVGIADMREDKGLLEALMAQLERAD